MRGAYTHSEVPEVGIVHPEVPEVGIVHPEDHGRLGYTLRTVGG